MKVNSVIFFGWLISIIGINVIMLIGKYLFDGEYFIFFCVIAALFFGSSLDKIKNIVNGKNNLKDKLYSVSFAGKAACGAGIKHLMLCNFACCLLGPFHRGGRHFR